MADPSTTERDIIEKLADSFMTSYRSGQRPSIDAYVEQYPDLADQLRGLITALIVLEQNAPHRERFEASPHRALRAGGAPREIGEFTIVREIGRGGMGVVYEAVQQSLGRHVALKVLSSGSLMNPVHLERFRLEARSAGRLHHSHIVPVFGVGEHDGLHYYAMQFIPGQSLDEVIDELRKLRPGHGDNKTAPLVKDELTASIAGGLLSGQFRGDVSADGDSAVDPSTAMDNVASKTSQRSAHVSTGASLAAHKEFSSGSSGRPFYESVARVGLQVAEALAYAHTEGMLHRDIKPSNLLLDAKGNAWVTDFGLVKAEDDQSLTETGDFVGTLRYMAPERLDGWSDRRSDIYGLGASLYELLTLHSFFESASRGQLIEHIRHVQPQPPTKLDSCIPRDLETIVLKALAKEPGSRYHTADEMADDLRRFLADRPILARRSTSREHFVRWCRRNPALASLTATVASALIAGTVVSTWQAVRASRAENLAEARLSAEAEARAAEAEQSKRAEAKQAEAEANYREAKAAVDRYFTLVSESTLFDMPALQPLRKDLLDAALHFYEKFAHERTDDPAVLADLAATHLRVSEVDFAANRTDHALFEIDQSLDLIDRLRQEFPAGREHRRQLAGYWKGYRPTQAPNMPKDAQSAFRSLNRLVETWRALAEENPEEFAFRSDLAAIYLRTGATMAHVVGQQAAGVVYLEKSRAVQERIVQERPEVSEYRADLARTYEWLATFLPEIGREDEGRVACRQALKLREQLVAELPNNVQYRSDLALSLEQFGVFVAKVPTEIEESFQRAVEIHEGLASDFPEAHIYRFHLGHEIWRLANHALAAGRHNEAEKFHRRALGIYQKLATDVPNNSLYQLEHAYNCWQLGELLKNSGYLQDAENLFRRAVPIYEKLASETPGDREALARVSEIYIKLADTLIRQGKGVEAEKVYGQAIARLENLGDDSQVRIYRGTLRRDMGDFDDAIAECDAMIAKDHKLAEAWDLRGSCHLHKGESAKAVEDYSEAIKLKPREAWYSHQRAYAYFMLGQHERSIADNTKAIEISDTDAGRRLRRGHSYRVLAQLQKAAADYARAVEINPAYWVNWYSRGRIYLERGERNQAEADFAKARELYPNDAGSLNYLARGFATSVDLNARDANLAVELATKGIELDPNSVLLPNTLGIAHYAAGNWQDAIEWLTNSLNLRNGGDGFDWFFLAMAHWQLGHKDESRKWYERAAEWMEENQPRNEELVRFRAEAEQLLGIISPTPPR